MTGPAFPTWLNGELDRQEVSRRELARRLATKHPEGLSPRTLESSRRAIYKYLNGESRPTGPTRTAIAEALGVDPSTVPDDTDEEEDLHLALLLRACRAKAHRQELPPRLEEWLRFGIRNHIFEEFSRKELVS